MQEDFKILGNHASRISPSLKKQYLDYSVIVTRRPLSSGMFSTRAILEMT